MLEVGVTSLENVVVPVPVTIVPPVRVSVQAPTALTEPVMFVGLPLQTVVLVLVIVAVGLAYTVIALVALAGDPQPLLTV